MAMVGFAQFITAPNAARCFVEGLKYLSTPLGYSRSTQYLQNSTKLAIEHK